MYTRRTLSRALKRQARTSCVAVLQHDGASELFSKVVKEAKAARALYARLATTWYGDSSPYERRLVYRKVPGTSSQVAVDPLTLQPSSCWAVEAD